MAATRSIESADPPPESGFVGTPDDPPHESGFVGTPEEAPAIGSVAEASAPAWQAWEVAAVIGVTALALLLRLHDYTSAPLFTDTADELQFTWAGLNLILHGDPITWSLPFVGYSSYTPFDAFGAHFTLVHHYLEHPPLFSLLMGGWVWLLGDRSMSETVAAQVRIPPIIFSSLCVLLAYLLGRRLLGRRPALIGAALLAVTPAAILFGRVAETESLIAVLLLTSLILTLRLTDGRAGTWTVAALLGCALAAPLAKLSGVAVGSICAAILLMDGRWRLALASVGVAAAAVGLFVLYGAILDWHNFLLGFQSQSGNRSGVLAGLDFITAPAGMNRRLRDGWWILGWIGVAAVCLTGSRRRQLYIAWPAAAYAATMMVMVGEPQAAQFGWYKWAVYPEVYLAAGWLVYEAVRQRSLPLLTVVLVLGFATATNWWLGGLDQAWVPSPYLLVVILAAFLAPIALAGWWKEDATLNRVAGYAALAALALMLLGSTVEGFFIERLFLRL